LIAAAVSSKTTGLLFLFICTWLSLADLNSEQEILLENAARIEDKFPKSSSIAIEYSYSIEVGSTIFLGETSYCIK
jgi:hypothetical protein